MPRDEDLKLKEPSPAPIDDHRFSQLLDSVPQLIWTTDAKGRYVYSNLQCLSYIPSAKMKCGWIHSIHPDDAKEVVPKWNASIASGEPFEAEFRLFGPDHVATWFLGRAIAVRDSEGKIKEWFGTAIDIHERRTADARRHRVQSMVSNLESISAALSIATSVDEVLEIIVEQGLAQLNDKSSVLVMLLKPEAKKPNDDDMLEFLCSRRFNTAEIETLRGLTKRSQHPIAECLRRREPLFFSALKNKNSNDGRAWTALPLLVQGELTGLLAVRYNEEPQLNESDTSFLTIVAEQCSQALERVRLLEAEQAARRTAESASRAKAEFLANMSHEIRTPMNAILGFADLLGDRSLSPDEREDYRRRIRMNGDQLMRLIDDVLDISKAETGTVHIEKLKFSVRELVHDIHRSMGAAAHRKGIRSRIVTASTVPEIIETDPVRLRQVLTNLIGNAIKFTDHGHIETRLSYADGELVIEIEDTGIGISEELHQRLFQPFAQGDSSITRRFGGSGLGLVVSRTIAAALGGTLELVRSLSGRGSLFRLGLPLEASPASLQIDMFEQLESKIADALPNRELEGVQVLLVEDSVDNEMLIRAYLKDTGVRLEVAHNGKEALDRARERNFDVVFMDIQMPVMDGLEATRRLRRRNYDRPIVALSAHALPEEVERSLAAGCHSHLTKPILRSALIAQIKSLAVPIGVLSHL
ncbi:hypothetical protein BH10BDE1_BH10BDE1_11510 [soil metagenome]